MKLVVSLFVALAVLGAGIALTQESRNPHGSIKWECETCHSTTSWKGLRADLRFDHDETGFRLDGAHGRADCIGCHVSPVFNHVSTACVDCHADHHEGQLGNNCSDCHTPRDWRPRQDVLMQHAERGFPLTGVHAVADCEACHHGRDRQEYVGTPTDCEPCHRSALLTATDPDHMQPAFQANCEQCHHPAFGTWTRTTYEHPASFPLTGAHRLLDCSSCHAAGFAGTPNSCYDCHSSDYAAATDPNHQLGGFATTCGDCHSTSAWVPSSFDHTATGFPLTGAHLQASCTSCHADGYAGTSGFCYDCHGGDYAATTDPNHQLAGFATTCGDCHSTSAWEPAAFDHNTTAFPLTGRHLTVTCISCHESTYTGTPSICYACHRTDFEATTDPNHSAAMFPTDCESCHTTDGWSPSTWDHDALYFPIYSGAHRNRWSDCVECHTVASDFSRFDCTACHEHNQTDMDDKHLGEVPGYQYLSSACYECHPRGTH
ncbi:MAG: hypothetical protein C4532_04090 [Candidatus Abyssobacteria bacterium SURF_17]|uniref:Cytochrome c7-like domain-containing protein n=1 Tax=Candidatus Abyssobacteria bacterium SURF_17 TaxID=2093361 RepID=A0A419F5H1_9BACT|nr:MAG: hypothetical protein C4532_04090 [Candidatus Abyssubacteria bacterium SURF_17]